MWSKIVGTGGVVLTAAATLFHAVNPAALTGKWAAGYAILGTILALFGSTPTASTESK